MQCMHKSISLQKLGLRGTFYRIYNNFNFNKIELRYDNNNNNLLI